MRRQMVGRAAVFLEADGTSVLTLAISIAQLARARVPVEADRLTRSREHKIPGLLAIALLLKASLLRTRGLQILSLLRPLLTLRIGSDRRCRRVAG